MNATRRFMIVFVVLLAGLATLTGCFIDGEERGDKLQAIARWEDRRLAPEDSLVTMLADTDAHVRLAAVRSAGLIGRHDALAPMLELLDDPSQTVREQACFSLGILGDTLAVPALETASASSRHEVAVAALRGLAHVPNRGEALLVAATGDDPVLAAAAFDGLRNQATRVPADALSDAIETGLVHAQADVRWRALRCAEVVGDTALVPMIIPHLYNPHDQVRVHAYRALARLGGDDARRSVLDAAGDNPLRGRAGRRVDIAACRALGDLFARTGDEALPEVAAYLIEMSGTDHAHVAATALNAMARLAATRDLPDEAAARESLLPVWRIRLARAAAGRLDHRDAAVRAAAVDARGALRGSGAVTEFIPRLEDETVAFAAAALARAVGTLSRQPEDDLAGLVGRGTVDPSAGLPASRWRQDATVVGAALAALADNASMSAHRLAMLLADRVHRAGLPSATDHDMVIGAVALELLDRHPSNPSVRDAIAVARTADEPWRSDLVLGTLGLLNRIWSDSTATWVADDSTVAMARDLVNRSLDDTDVRVRLAARDLAEASELLPAKLIPDVASLRATIPAHRRHPAQPAVRLPFDAPTVRCPTDRGEFEIELDTELAPNTCAMFLDLIEQGFYDGLIFHRVVPDFVVQGGDPTGTGWGGPGYTIRSEWSATPYTRGKVGIAHSGKDTGGCQWFVTLSEQPHLVGRYTIFGEVTDGMEILDAMQPGDRFTLTAETK